MSAHRCRNRGPSNVLRRGCHQKRPEFDECFRPSTWIHVLFPAVRRVQRANYVHSGTSKAKYCLALRARHSCNQPFETMLGIRCAAEACNAPNMSPLQADANAIILHARHEIISLRLQIRLFRVLLSSGDFVEIKQFLLVRNRKKSTTNRSPQHRTPPPHTHPRRKKILKFFLHCLWRSRFPTCACFRVHTAGHTPNMDGFRLK